MNRRLRKYHPKSRTAVIHRDMQTVAREILEIIDNVPPHKSTCTPDSLSRTQELIDLALEELCNG